MTDLNTLRAASETAHERFVSECRVHGFADEWAAYRAESGETPWPAPLAASHKAYIAAIHAFYEARDGKGGFLGGRGL